MPETTEPIPSDLIFDEQNVSIGDAEIDERFYYHAPTDLGVARHAVLSEEFSKLARALDRVCPPGRSKSLAFTALEEAKMHASAAVARDPRTV